MTRYTGNEPIEPFHVSAKHVPARTVRCSASSGETSGGGSTKPTRPTLSLVLLEELGSIRGQAAIGVLIAAAYVLVRLRPEFSGITVLVLLGAVMYRMDPRRRRIAAAPVTLAAAMLARQIAESGIDYRAYGFSSLAAMPHSGTAWMPLFLAACLVYSPKFPTNTGTILMAISLLLLGSGLVPGGAYVPIFATIQYFLFIAVAVGLGVDFKENATGPATASTPKEAL